MSDSRTPDPYDRTRRLEGSPTPADPTAPLGGGSSPADVGTRRMPAAQPGRAAVPIDGTQVMPGTAARPQPLAYTEDYAAHDVGSDTYVEGQEPRGGGPRPAGPLPEEEGRTFTPAALALGVVAALLVGAILTLLLLPEEEPQVVLADQQAQVALAEAQEGLAESQAATAAQSARIVELEALVAERDVTIAALQQQLVEGGNQAAADQAAADQALAEQQAQLEAREVAVAEREAAADARDAQIAERETAVAAAEQQGSGGGITLPDLGDIEVPGGLPADLPQIDEDQARGIVERFIDRLSSFFG